MEEKIAAIVPIRFSDDPIQPIRFVDEGTPLYPLKWQTVQVQEDGRINAFYTEDRRLVGFNIPQAVKHPQQYLAQQTYYLNNEPLKDSSYGMIGIISGDTGQERKSNVGSNENFKVIPMMRQIYLNVEGKEICRKEQILCKLIFDDGITEKFSINVTEISKIVKKIQSRYAKAMVDYSEKNVEKRIENEFRFLVKSCPSEICFLDAGWQKVQGRWRYLYDEVPLPRGMRVETGMHLTIKGENAYEPMEILEKARHLYKDQGNMTIMLVYAFTGVLYRVFEEAGFPLKFLLFINGTTGSMKTTIGKILYTQMYEEGFRDNVRRVDSDTEASLERAIVLKGRDTVTLIDDFSPAKTQSKKNDMINKLELLIRMVGDGSTKSRSNKSLNDCRGEGVHGMIIITGELQGKGLSSNLRCLYSTLIKNGANVEAVSWFQNNPNAFPSVISEFAKYVEKNWNDILQYIKITFPQYREKVSLDVKQKRIVDSAVALQIISKIILQFLDRGKITKQQLEFWEKAEELILSCATRNEAMLIEESPGVMFISGVLSLIKSGQISIKAGKFKEEDLARFDGFEDLNFIFLNPEVTLRKVIGLMRSLNQPFLYDMREITAFLAEEGILRTTTNGNGKRCNFARVKIGDRKYSLYKIHKEIFERIFTEGGGCFYEPDDEFEY